MANAGGGRIRILIADDHPLYLEGLADTVTRRPELELVGQVGQGREAFDAIARMRPDVAVLDLNLADMTAVELLERLAEAEVDTRSLIVSGQYDSEAVYAALAAGAAGYLSKDASGTDICEAVEAVARGDTVLGPDVQAAVAQEIRRRVPGVRQLLSEREQQVLELIAEGLSAPDIAERLGVATTTVKTHLQNLYEKLGVSDRAAAVAEGIRRGLLD
jgi:two-component system, NarL family, nitrate/nitrite response regulator NarL